MSYLFNSETLYQKHKKQPERIRVKVKNITEAGKNLLTRSFGAVRVKDFKSFEDSFIIKKNDLEEIKKWVTII